MWIFYRTSLIIRQKLQTPIPGKKTNNKTPVGWRQFISISKHLFCRSFILVTQVRQQFIVIRVCYFCHAFDVRSYSFGFFQTDSQMCLSGFRQSYVKFNNCRRSICFQDLQESRVSFEFRQTLQQIFYFANN